MRKYALLVLPAFCALLLFSLEAAAGGSGHSAHHGPAHAPPYWTVAPFVLMLLGIAVIPLVSIEWWERDRNKGILSGVLGTIILVYLFFFAPEGSMEKLAINMLDYVAFISLLAALFIIAGGIYIKGTLAGSPAVNSLILLIGSVLASFMGTTGAGMLLIRPLIRANSWRRSRHIQVIFFIFLVTNIGGLLTPLGDPPLFLGFLKRVPFQWTFRLTPQWLFAVLVIIAVFYMIDTYMYKKDLREGARPPEGEKEPIRLEGWHNFIFQAMIVGVILLAGIVSQRHLVAEWFGVTNHIVIDAVEKIGQSALMLIVAGSAYRCTKRETRGRNNFGWGPISEVAILFLGIFITMIPALWILDHLGASNKLGIDRPWHFFWVTGTLSSFLDNAPTYLTFTAAASGLNHTDPNNLLELIHTTKEQTGLAFAGVNYLKAISVGAVFMGANTYIGNGPNFMVKAIAEENGIKMPSFFGYMLYSIVFLFPIFIITTLVFFSGLL
jgi:Na+/H+ antiporter NhaD/arsenite permease-like protein